MTQPNVRLSSKALGGAIAGLLEAPAQVATTMAASASVTVWPAAIPSRTG